MTNLVSNQSRTPTDRPEEASAVGDLKDELVESVLHELFGPPGAEAPTDGPVGPALDLSICSMVEQRLAQVTKGSLDAFDPGPIVDATMSRLVELTITDFGTNAAGPATQRERFHWDVVEAVCRNIDVSPYLTERARILRHGASVAEAAMERHFAARVVDGPALATASARLTDDRSRLRLSLGAFPYSHNYEA